MKRKKRKFSHILLRITMYSFILFMIAILSLFTVLFIYSKNLNYEMPEVVQIEIYNSDNQLISRINNKSNRKYVRIEDISQPIIDSFLTIEDKEYFNHQGINLKRIIKALMTDIKEMELKEGASTITQQYVKNTFLTNEKTFKRKIDEALIAIHLESKYTKQEILEAYINSIYFDHGLYGINDACLFYFNKEPKDININEAAILASIPKSPSNYSPIKNPENNNNRRLLVLSELLKDNKITEEEYDYYKNKETKIFGKLESSDIRNSPYYQDIIIKELKNMNIDYSKGVKVFTTVDNTLNTIIENSIKKYYDPKSNLELSIVCMDKNGNVLSNIGGIDYLKSTYNRSFSLRQPGSTIKTFLYYAALKNGFNVSNTFMSTKTTFNVDGNSYSPSNYNNIYPNKDVSMLYAIATSDNIYAVKTHLFMGTNVLYNTLKNFGFTSKLNNNASLALGTSEVSLNELTLAYAKIASLGKDLTPTYITKITDIDDKLIYQKKYTFEQKYDYNTCYLLSEALTSVFDYNIKINATPTCASINSLLSTTYAAKSGSTNYDAWIVGYNPEITLGIWTGFDNNTTVNNVDTKFIKSIWASIMEEYNKIKKVKWYDTPKGIIAIKLDPIGGNLVMDNSYQKYMYYDIHNLPQFIY